MRSKKRRVESESEELETEATIDSQAYDEFVKRMSDHRIERDSSSWKLLFDEVVVERLKARNPTAWMRLMRARRLESEGARGEDQGHGEKEEAADDGQGEGGEGYVEADEGRNVRIPTVPYVPTARERREHNVTHYPHRTWCDVCMRGRGIAGKHVSGRDETDPRAGEFHFDYCFLKNEVKDEPAVTLVGVDKASDAILAHVVPEKGTKFDWVAAQLDRDVKRFGYHGRIVVKSDGENAVCDLMQELARKRRENPTVAETSKPYDSEE